jgi:hypothetical protein
MVGFGGMDVEEERRDVHVEEDGSDEGGGGFGSPLNRGGVLAPAEGGEGKMKTHD